MGEICSYCGKTATHQFKNGKWCCSDNISKCQAIREKLPWNKGMTGVYSDEALQKMRASSTGKKHTKKTKRKMSSQRKGITQTPSHTKETRQKISRKLRGRIPWNHQNLKQLQKRYPTFAKAEELREDIKTKKLYGHCKNHNCKHSKEKGGWFELTRGQITERIRSLEHPDGSGESNFYCSEECKVECPLYNLHPMSMINNSRKMYTDQEYNIWRRTLLIRENNKCEYCGKKATIVHHIRPQKLEPFFSLDPDNGVACCFQCHYKYGHVDECSTTELAKIICTGG